MKKLYYAIMAMCLLGANSCSNEDAVLEESQNVTLTATIDEAQTKVGFEENGKFYWSNNDQIATFKNPTNPGLLVIKKGQGTATATFEGLTPDLGKYAIYPYQAGHKLNGDELSFNIGGWQKGTLGTNFFDGTAAERPSTKAPMWGEIIDGKVSFKHLGGVFCIKLSDMPQKTSFSVVLDADQRLNGAFTVNLTDKTPTIKTDNNKGHITMAGLNNEIGNKNGIVYIQAPTGTFNNLKITVDSKVKKTYEKVTVNRGDLVILSDK